VFSTRRILVIIFCLFLLTKIAGAAPFTYKINDNNTVSVIDHATNMVTGVVTYGGGTADNNVAVSPDGKTIYLNYHYMRPPDYCEGVSIVDVATCKETSFIETDMPYGITISPDGNRLYIYSPDLDYVKTVDLRTNSIIATLGIRAVSTAINSDGTRLFVRVLFDSLQVVDTSTNAIIAQYESTGISPIIIKDNKIGVDYGVINASTGFPDTVPDIRICTYPDLDMFFSHQVEPNEISIYVYPCILENSAIDCYVDGKLAFTETKKLYRSNLYVSESFIFSPGTHEINVDYRIWDNNGKQTILTTATKEITVLDNEPSVPETPTITWPKPVDIIYGTPLGSDQLSASASVPGTFVYTPAEGTLLSEGIHTLHVDFIPDDTMTYSTASADVVIYVFPSQQISVPEFPSVALPTVAVLGMIAVFGRKKE